MSKSKLIIAVPLILAAVAGAAITGGRKYVLSKPLTTPMLRPIFPM